MLGVERRHHKIIGPAQIVAYRRLPGDEGAPLRRGLIGTRDDVSDDAGVPAVSGFDQKIVLRLAISAHFGERHAEAVGADPRGFRQDLQQIALAKGKTAKSGNRRLLAKKFADHGVSVIHLFRMSASQDARRVMVARGNKSNPLLPSWLTSALANREK